MTDKNMKGDTTMQQLVADMSERGASDILINLNYPSGVITVELSIISAETDGETVTFQEPRGDYDD